MPFNISAFKENGLVYGGARASQFMVFLSVPTGIGIDNVSVDKFRFVCKAAELPPSDLGQIEVPYFGRKIKVAGDREFPNWSISVMNDEDFSVRALFEAWSNSINRLVANVRDPNTAAEQYKVDLEIVQYGKDGSTIRSYLMVGAWPASIGGIPLNWEAVNSIQEFPVNFSYDYWIPLVESSDKKAGGINIYGNLSTVNGPNGAS